MVADASNVPQQRVIITSHTVGSMHVKDDVLHAVATTSIWDSFDDC